MFWVSEPVVLGLRSTDWWPLLGSNSPLAALLSISHPLEPPNQGPVVGSGKDAPELVFSRLGVVPSTGTSNPQSTTRFPATAHAAGAGVGVLVGVGVAAWALTVAASVGVSIAISTLKTLRVVQMSALPGARRCTPRPPGKTFIRDRERRDAAPELGR
jgi:hypothetical protein